MKTNGVVHRLMSSPPGLERWEAKCAATLGIGMHLRVIHKLTPKKRRVEERET